VAKRAIDVGLAMIGCALTLPLQSAIAIAIVVFQGRPVFFRQSRPGLLGKPFSLVKFRTMRAGSGPDCDRLTRFGLLLRRLSLDELPTLWNVIQGDASIVGPRPLLTEYLARYSPLQARRHDVRPGVTGWAQINGRNTLSWEKKLALDVWYVDHQSLTLDLRIVLKTFWKVLVAQGISQPGKATVEEFKGG
jgi:sugar transferase EpsL